MSRKFYLSVLAIALLTTASVAFVVGHSLRTPVATGNSALAALPASDFVISVDVQRALNETLPSMLAANPTLLAKLNTHLQEFQQKTGIDPRVFESVAIGGSLDSPHAGSGGRDYGSVVIARGSFNSTALLDAGFAAAQKECRFEKEEQQYEGRTIYLISAVRPSVAESAGADAESGAETKLSATAARHTMRQRFAVAIIDANTIAVGSPESVRAAIDASLGRNRLDDELVRLASQTPNAAISFSGRIPQQLAEKTAAGNPIGKYFASVREFYGSFSASGSEAESLLALRTEKAEQASDIGQALNSMKSLVGLGFAQSTGSSTQADALANLLKGVTITTQGNEVQINSKFQPQSLAPFVHRF